MAYLITLVLPVCDRLSETAAGLTKSSASEPDVATACSSQSSVASDERRLVARQVLAVAVGGRDGHRGHHGRREADARAHRQADQQPDEQPADGRELLAVAAQQRRVREEHQHRARDVDDRHGPTERRDGRVAPPVDVEAVAQQEVHEGARQSQDLEAHRHVLAVRLKGATAKISTTRRDPHAATLMSASVMTSAVSYREMAFCGVMSSEYACRQRSVSMTLVRASARTSRSASRARRRPRP